MIKVLSLKIPELAFELMVKCADCVRLVNLLFGQVPARGLRRLQKAH